MNVSSTSDSQKQLSVTQKRVVRKVMWMAAGLAIGPMIVGSLVDWLVPTGGRNVSATIFGLMLLPVWYSRYAYSRGVTDATSEVHERAQA